VSDSHSKGSSLGRFDDVTQIMCDQENAFGLVSLKSWVLDRLHSLAHPRLYRSVSISERYIQRNPASLVLNLTRPLDYLEWNNDQGYLLAQLGMLIKQVFHL
jgi:hypothetical protein